jgi:hypothetical protein
MLSNGLQENEKTYDNSDALRKTIKLINTNLITVEAWFMWWCKNNG